MMAGAPPRGPYRADADGHISPGLGYVGLLPSAVRITYNSPHSSPQGGTIAARLVRAGSARTEPSPLGTAAFRNTSSARAGRAFTLSRGAAYFSLSTASYHSTTSG